MNIKIKKALKIISQIFYKTFKFGSLQSVITIYFGVIIILVIVFMSAIIYSKFVKTVDNNAVIGTSQTINQVNRNLQYYLQGMNEVSNTVAEQLNSPTSNGIEKARDVFKMTITLRKDIESISVFTEDGKMMVSTSNLPLKKGLDVKSEDWFQKVIEEPGKINFSNPHVQNLYKGEHRWVVSLSKEVKYNKNGKEIRLIALVDMKFTSIDELCHLIELGKKGYVYIINNDGIIIYHPQQQLIYTGLKNEKIDFAVNNEDGSYIQNNNGEKTVMTIKTVGYTGWKIVGISYYNEMVTSKKEIYYYIISVVAVSIIVLFVMSLIISARISLPIKKLEKLMARVEKGELDIYAEIKGEDEVKQLSKTFNSMISRIRNLMDEIFKEQEAKRKSEIKALQAQINPHFLYNTLDSIVWMAENGESKGVITMVIALANLFRTSISRGKEIIKIKDELENARSYLVIQQMRYTDKFDYIIEADEAVLEYRTFKIVLQPIIENSIYHGIKRMVDRGMIKVTAEIIDDKLLLQVIDNGLGMSKETAESILSKEPKGKVSSGIGVKNVHERIQLYFGNEYGLEIESELEVGTCVKIWLPKLKEEVG